MSKLTIGPQDVQAAYDELGHEWGWSFLAGPESQLYTAQMIIVGLNSARAQGDCQADYGAHWDVPEGNIYFSTNWGGGGRYTPLQEQLLRWHDLLDLSPEQTVGANFVPFRSRSWAELANPIRSVQFANNLWQNVLSVTSAPLFITMGKNAAWHLAKPLGAKHVATLASGWGKHTIDVYDCPSGRRLVAMPHPSRFKLFNRGERSRQAEDSFLAACNAEKRLERLQSH